ncbi:MAG: hypothetical protein HC888_07345 [Candidatus Competibacteraceae bacterium]|nr:hypothetical protein [Candidatus Competibacteraceae bacterium]
MVPDARAFLLKLFASRFGSRLSTPGTDVWRSLSQFYALSDEELLASLDNGSRAYRALCIDDREAFLLFSFSPQGRAEDAALWQVFCDAMSRLSVTNLRLFQLSEESDYQVYLHFEKLAKIAPLQELFTSYLVFCGLEKVKVHGVGEYFVLPLQSGFRWMNEAVQPVVARREMSLEVACNFFLAEILKSTICSELLTENLHQELRSLEAAAPCEVELIAGENDEPSPPANLEPVAETAVVCEAELELPEAAAVCDAELDLPEGQEVFAAALEIIAQESVAPPEALVSADEAEALFLREEFPDEVIAQGLAEDLEVSAATVERLFQLDHLDEGQSEIQTAAVLQPDDISVEAITQLDEVQPLIEAPYVEPLSPVVLTVSSDSTITPSAYCDSDDHQIEADASRPMRYVQLYFPFAEGLVKPTYFEEMPLRRPTRRRGTNLPA